ncbi:MAG: DUF262 domain-containing protein, partial [bacterium]
MNLLDQVQNHRNHIKHEQLTFSLSELVNMYMAEPKEIEIRPDFQRLFRWTRTQQSSFIESIVLEMPIPPLFFFEKDDGTWDLLDGLQRLSTIIKFIGTGKDVPKEYQVEDGNENEWHYKNENNIEEPLQLLAGEYLTALSGLTFVRLPTQLQLNIKRSRLTIYILKRETKEMYKYEVFKRLNRGGIKLEEQEIRNCSVRLIDDKFPKYLQVISKNDDFVNALGLKQERILNAYIEELALRYLTMKNNLINFKHDVDDLMTSYMELVAGKKMEFDFEGEEKLFGRVWKCISQSITDGDAFKMKTEDRKNIGPFAPALFEMISIGIASNIDKVEKMESE